jgi:uncharacterized protein YcfJ
MKKTILALAAAGLLPLCAGAASPTEPAKPAEAPPAPPSSAAAPSASPAPSTSPAPTRFEPKTMYGDVARVLSTKPVYEKTFADPRECRLEGSGYSSAASELPPCKPGDTRERIVAYDVNYQYMGREFLIRMPYDPGEQMAVNVIVVPPAPEPRSGYRIPRTRGPY